MAHTSDESLTLAPRHLLGANPPPAQPEPWALGSSRLWQLQQPTHRAAILQHRIREPAVALSPDLHIIGTLDEQGLLEVASCFVQVGYAVLAVVSDVLGAFSGQQAQEGHLDVGSVGSQVVIPVAELLGQRAVV